MRVEGKVIGCEACRETMLKEIARKEQEENALARAGLEMSGQIGKKITKSLADSRKSLSRKKKILPGGGIEGEPKWWGSGVSRLLAGDFAELFIEEIEEDITERTYAARKAKALYDRKKWAEFLILLKKKYVEALHKSLGPDWFQDLSSQQTGLIDQLNEILEADIQEGISARTQRALKEIGIHPPLSTHEVSRCMQECHFNIIRFLFMLHKVVVEREQASFDEEFKEAAKENLPVQVYSINERLLLSGVFHVHFPEFTNKLDQLLPAPPEKPKLILPKKLPPEPKIKYKSPYLEPLPLPPKVWFEQRVEDELYAEQALLVALQEKKEFEKKVLKEAEEQKKAKEDKLRKLLELKSNFGTSKSLKKTLDSSLPPEFVIPPRENKSQVFKRFSQEKSVEGVKKSSSVSSKSSKSSSKISSSKSILHVRKNRRYMYDVVHETIQTKTSFGGFFAKDNRLIKDTEGANLKIRLIPRNEKVVCLYRDEDFKPLQILDTRVRICCRDVGIQTDSEPLFLPLNVNPEVEFYKLMEKITTVNEAFTNTDDINEQELEKTDTDASLSKKSSLADKTIPKSPCANEAKTINTECVDNTCALVETENIPMDEYVMMKKKIELYPPEKQLKAAVAFLCRRGDPMAVLPRVDETPWLLRWFELRRGIKEKLTPEEKEDLLQVSQRLWLSKYKNVSTIVAKPFKIKRKVTTLQQKWLMNKIDSHKLDFQTKMRRQLVNNAREYFPTFFNEYFTSPLNKSFRKTFFTYLSSKEMAADVFRVWTYEPKNPASKDNNNSSAEA